MLGLAITLLCAAGAYAGQQTEGKFQHVYGNMTYLCNYSDPPCQPCSEKEIEKDYCGQEGFKRHITCEIVGPPPSTAVTPPEWIMCTAFNSDADTDEDFIRFTGFLLLNLVLCISTTTFVLYRRRKLDYRRIANRNF